LICLIILVSGCALPPNLDDIHPVGSKYSGEIKLGDKRIPLPEGEWEMAACGTVRQFFKAYLVKRCEFNKFNLIFITVDKPFLERNRGYVNSLFYRKKTLHHSVVKSNTAGKAQDAWCIANTNITIKRSKNNSIYNKLLKYISVQNLPLNNFFIKIVHRLTGWGAKKDYVYLSYFVNPETKGYPTGNWSDWNVARINNYPARVDLIEHLKTVGAKQHSELKEGVGKKR
jgi:hypothetical protein